MLFPPREATTTAEPPEPLFISAYRIHYMQTNSSEDWRPGGEEHWCPLVSIGGSKFNSFGGSSQIRHDHVFHVVLTGFIGHGAAVRIMVDNVGNDGVGQRSRDQDAVSGTAMDIRDDEAARVAQRRHAAPVRIVVADADGRMRFKPLRRIVDQTVQNDMVDFVAACVQETHDLAAAGRMARHVADLDVRDVVVVRRKRAGDHRASVNACLPASVADGRQRDQIIARVSRNRLDDNVMAALPQVDAVLVQHRHRLAVYDFF